MIRRKLSGRIMALLLALVMVVGLLPTAALAADTIKIGSEAELIKFGERVNGGESTLDAVLTDDITIASAWTPMGLKASPYSGTFNGKGFTVTISGGITFSNTTERYGLFDTVSGKVQNLKVDGTVNLGTQAGNVGGVAGYLEASGTVIGCTNAATVSGKNNVGGIVGMSAGNISQCSSTGTINTMNTSNAGGIVGMSSSGSSVSNCCNSGAVTTKTTGAGGIMGSYSGSNQISNCYNTGMITATTNTAGGIIGVPGFSTILSLSGVYNIGAIAGASPVGGIVGKETKDSNIYANCFYLNTASSYTGTIKGSNTGAPVSKSAEELKDLASTLGDAFADDTGAINGGYPVLAWQVSGGSTEDSPLSGSVTISGKVYVGGMLTASYSGDETVSYQWYRGTEVIENTTSAAYTVTADDITSELKVSVSAEGYVSKTESAGTVPNYVAFDVTPADATVTVTGSDQMEWIGTEGIYALPVGSYTYTVSAGGEYEDATASFTVPHTADDGMISVNLPLKTYAVSFTTVPTEAVLTVKKGGVKVEPAVAGTKTYQLAKGDYTYSVSAFGYESKTDEAFTVTEAEAKTITLEAQPRQTVTITVDRAAGGPDTVPSVVVRDAAGIVRDYTKGLPAGTYTYTAVCSGYQSASGEFTVADDAVTIQKTLAVLTAWDGVTLTEPSQDAQGTYLIGSAAELFWFGKNAALSADAKLILDITINEDMAASEDGLYKWTPKGTSSAKFTGSLDGDGHTISGLYVNQSGNGAGLIGYADTAAEISNLTVAGKIVGGGNYTGGIVGDCKGTVTNCHNLAEINGKTYVGGVIGDLETGGTILNCSNRGSVTATDKTVGGVVGRIDSGSASAVQNCYNTGTVRGTSNVGGVIGDQYAYGSAVTNVYNIGMVTATTGYAGGILGNFRSGTLANTYMACTVNGGSDTARGKVAGVLEAPTQQKTLSGVYYLDTPIFDSVANLNSCTIQNGVAVSKSADEFKSLSSILGDAFTADTQHTNGGYPILKWQTGETTEPEAPSPDLNGWDGKVTKEPALRDGVYQIGTAPEFAWFAGQLKTHSVLNAVLTADIDLNHQNWTPMCGAAENAAYTGSFNGQGHTVQNLYLYSKKSAAALFAGNAGSIENLTVAGQVIGADYTAALVAYNYGSIDNCRTNAAVAGGNYVSGIVAQNKGSITNAFNAGSVSAAKYAGGVAASNASGGVISQCFNTGEVKSAADFSGGVCAANKGSVSDCYNTGLVICKAALLRSYAGGVIGWNNGTASDLYNTGSVVSMGSYTGGVVGIVTSGKSAENLYGVGNVMGMYYEDNDGYEQYYVGGAAGRKTDNVKNAYFLKSLAVTTGGTAKTETELKAQGFPVQLGSAFVKDSANLNGGYPVLAWQTAANTPAASPAMDGTVTITGNLQSGGTLTASYSGGAGNPVFVWYFSDEDGEYTLSIGSDTYTIPVDAVGKLIRVKVFSETNSGTVSGMASDRIEGMNGSIALSGAAVVGKTLTATYSRPADGPHFQWYHGSTPIDGATGGTYTVTSADVGYLLKVRVTGDKAGYVEKALTSRVTTAESAGVWPDSQCTEPANVGGVYVITTEAELHWFVSEVNGGNGAIKAKLSDNLTLDTDGWYPIGTDASPFAGTFDGNSKTIDGFALSTAGKGEQGFFGHISGNGEVKNLTVSGAVAVTGDNAVGIGGVAGYVEGRISGCTFTGSVSGYSQVGGIAGLIGLHGMVTESRNKSTVSGHEQIGGIAGASSYGDTYYCVNNGAVGDANAKNVGGIVGDTQNYAVITGCYNTGAIQGNSQVGGISGKVYVSSAPLGCYSVGSVTGGLYTGGVLGSIGGTDYIPTVTGSFYLNTLPKDTTATGKSESAMKDTSFVTALNNDAFTVCYVADNGTNGGYPILKWEAAGHSNPDSGGSTLPTKERITVSFTLLGDSIHGDNAHTGGTVTWIERTTLSGLPNTTTAYDLFRQVLGDNDYTYESKGSSYVAYITSPSGVRLGEFSNGAYSGWMYTVNSVFPDYMASVTLKDGDDMVFFFTDDYRKTGWNPNGKPGESVSNGSYGTTEPVTNSSINLQPKAAVSGSTAVASVTEKELTDAISAISKSGESAITITPTDTSSAKSVSVTLPKTAAQAIVDDTNVSLVIETNGGNVTISNDALKSIASQASGSSITITVEQKTASDVTDKSIDTTDAVIMAVTVTSNGKSITSFGGKSLTISIPAGSKHVAGQSYKVIEISTDGTAKTLTGKCVKVDGKLVIQVSTSGLSTFVVTTQKAMPFTDVSGHWALEGIQYAYNNGLFAGSSDTTFSPDTAMTRAMLVTVLYRMEGSPAVTGTSSFTDVKAGQYYTDAVIWANSNGIVGGYGNGLFGSNDSITREQMAAILYRYAQYKKYDVSIGEKTNILSYTDAERVSEYAIPAMQWACGTGLISGTTSSTLSPAGTASRAQVATILMRFAENVAK